MYRINSYEYHNHTFFRKITPSLVKYFMIWYSTQLHTNKIIGVLNCGTDSTQISITTSMELLIIDGKPIVCAYTQIDFKHTNIFQKIYKYFSAKSKCQARFKKFVPCSAISLGVKLSKKKQDCLVTFYYLQGSLKIISI